MKTRFFGKIISFVVSSALMAGLFFTGGFTIHSYATVASALPSVNYFATKAQLKDAFTTDEYGRPDTNSKYYYSVPVGLLSFGKNESNIPQKWYILGKDTGVSGDNIVLFAADTMMHSMFKNQGDQSRYNYDIYDGGMTITVPVYNNHYGASALRNNLNQAFSGTGFFSETEKSLTNITSVETKDVYQSTSNNIYPELPYVYDETTHKYVRNIRYVTSDYLYCLSGELENGYLTRIYAGSNDDVVVLNSRFSTDNAAFYLRNPDESDSNCARVTCDRSNGYKRGVFIPVDVRPALNLNLDSVLFTSAASLASSSNQTSCGTIYYHTPMRIRLPESACSSENCAVRNAAIYYDDNGNIYASGVSSPVIFVIQGRNDSTDWYYSKYIESSESRTKILDTADIKSSISAISEDIIDLSKCMMWVETVETDNDSISYATDPFSVTRMSTLVSVASPAARTGIANGTAKTASALGLPTAINITVSPASSTITSVPVTWDVAGSSYNPSSSEAQTFTVNGVISLPGGVDNSSNIPLTVSISVIVNRAETTGGNNGGGSGTGGSESSNGGSNSDSNNGDSNGSGSGNNGSSNGGSNGNVNGSDDSSSNSGSNGNSSDNGGSNGGENGSDGGSNENSNNSGNDSSSENNSFNFSAYGLSNEYVPDGYSDNSGSPMVIDGKDLSWNESNGKSYWYENGVKQGTYYDPKGVIGDGTNRGREICDNNIKDLNGNGTWFWLDACYDGAKAVGKEVWVPYIYQNEAEWDDATLRNIANESDAGMADLVYIYMKEKNGKWVRYDEEGRMIKGWVTIQGALADKYPDQVGNTYYYDTRTGLMAKGNVKIGGVEHFFDETTGVMVY